MGNRGRQRSEKTEQAILDAAYALLLENGFHALTIEGIAKKAGVSKATIYRWWPNKAAVASDSFFAAAAARLPVPDTGVVEQDLFEQIHGLCGFLATDQGRVITELIAEGQYDPEVAAAYRTGFFQPRRRTVRQILLRGAARGEIRADADIELCIDLVFAPLFYRLLITGAAVDDAFLHKLVSYTLRGLHA